MSTLGFVFHNAPKDFVFSAVKNDKSLTDAVYIIYNTILLQWSLRIFYSLSINFIVQNDISALKE